MKKIYIKEWLYDKEQDKASSYNIYFDAPERDAENHNCVKVVNGYVAVIAEVLSETEKAIRMRIESGEVVGSVNGWTCWMPKSQVKIA